jgi:hypothetical protein
VLPKEGEVVVAFSRRAVSQICIKAFPVSSKTVKRDRLFWGRGDLSMQSDLERLLSRSVSTLQKPEVTMPWKPDVSTSRAKITDRYLHLMRCVRLSKDERQEFHDLMDLELNKPVHPERSDCIDDYRRFLPSTIDEQFHELIKLALSKRA